MSDTITYSYVRQGGLSLLEHGNGTVHAYDMDKLGRVVEDRVTVLGIGVNGAVRRVETAYDTRGLVNAVTSYDDPEVGSGNVVNEVKLTYDGFGNLVEEAQSHSGVVGVGTPKVSYSYANGSANTIRCTSMTYPGGAVLSYGYGSPGSADDRLSRLAELTRQGESVAVARFDWLGSGRLVTLDFEEPGLELSYKKSAGEPVGDAGDPYTGYDRFGRTVDMRWTRPSASETLSRIQYGYDRLSRRKWRQELAAAEGTGQDNYWSYDGLGQIVGSMRGTLNINRTAVGGVPVERESFIYDPVGNWAHYGRQSNGSMVLDQSRGYSQDNEMVTLDEQAAGLAFDEAGNATETKPDKTGDWSKGYKITWDAWNMPVTVSDTKIDALVASYSYDGMARRIVSTVSEAPRHFYYDDRWKSVEERVGSATVPQTLHVWSNRSGHRDELVRRERDSSGGGTLDEKLYCMMDYFDPVAITNSSGTVQERYGFSAFGLARIMAPDFSLRASSSFGWQFLFHGQFRDEETGWDNYGYRYYSPHMGRWFSRDPIGEKGGVNLYAMVGNDPASHVDLYGLACYYSCTCGAGVRSGKSCQHRCNCTELFGTTCNGSWNAGKFVKVAPVMGCCLPAYAFAGSY